MSSSRTPFINNPIDDDGLHDTQTPSLVPTDSEMDTLWWTSLDLFLSQDKPPVTLTHAEAMSTSRTPSINNPIDQDELQDTQTQSLAPTNTEMVDTLWSDFLTNFPNRDEPPETPTSSSVPTSGVQERCFLCTICSITFDEKYKLEYVFHVSSITQQAQEFSPQACSLTV
ncbi:hypothetical protein sscle_14g099470 [Sclerotinia sclerotiorum 1980 UF-70]|uniref:Uncharacterized protein n=1 Tax=Sclerotinia sclerotiorum (strain ATCC 18683 / 1980 / Ss-1) TaxID=665079 RepID=A0A1D9QJQ8_SCLS1|nr:hypothetical protein sscle_14g099470 [Sclerotinia sclerotiorum 1980 UF-70]